MRRPLKDPTTPYPFKRFQLIRDKDVSGVSGTGVVAWGVRFPNGKVALSWNGRYTSVVVYDSISDAEAVHGHHGSTYINWL